MDFREVLHVTLARSGQISPIELGPVLMQRYAPTAIKNDQEHCLTPSEPGDRSSQSESWRSCNFSEIK